MSRVKYTSPLRSSSLSMSGSQSSKQPGTSMRASLDRKLSLVCCSQPLSKSRNSIHRSATVVRSVCSSAYVLCTSPAAQAAEIIYETRQHARQRSVKSDHSLCQVRIAFALHAAGRRTRVALEASLWSHQLQDCCTSGTDSGWVWKGCAI